jgi:hypothetical protein
MGEESVENIMYCTECGAVIKPEENVCQNCGTDQSKIIDENQPDPFVTFKILPNTNAAEHMQKLLAASGIMSETRPSPTNKNAEAVSVLVHIPDLDRAKEITVDSEIKSDEMHLTDIFSITFSIAGKTFKNNIIVASLLIPAVLILISGINLFISSINISFRNNRVFISGLFAQEGEQAVNSPVNIFMFTLTVLIFIITVTAIYYGIIKTVGLVMEKKEYSVRHIFNDIFSSSFLMALISFLSFIIAVAGPYLIILLLLSIFKDNMLILMFLPLLLLTAVIWFIYASIKFSFAFVHTTVSGEGAIDSLKKSSFLVKGYWWRTFGILIVVSLVCNFIASLILAPGAFFLRVIFLPHPDNLRDLGAIKMFLSNLALTSALSIILKSLIEPIFITVMYYDLKERKNEFYFINEVPEIKQDTPETTEIV